MAYQLEIGEMASAGIRRIAIERIEYIETWLTDDTNEREKAVHEARKSFKRLRALLRLIRYGISDVDYKRENLCFRDASRLLSGARDSAVMLETFDKLPLLFESEWQADAFAPFRESVVTQYETGRLLTTDNGGAIQTVLTEMTSAIAV